MSRLNILLLATETANIQRVTQFLKTEIPDLNLQRVDSLRLLKRKMNSKTWDIFLVDATIPSCRYTEALQAVGELIPGLLRLVLMDGLDEEEVVRAMKAGADNLVTIKRLERLIPIIYSDLTVDRNKNDQKEILKQYDLMLNSSGSFITLIDKEYKYVAINETFCRAHNLKRQDVLGKSLADIWGRKKFDEMIRPPIDECFKNKNIKYEAWFETPTLGLRFFRVSYSPYISKENVVQSVVVETKDITQQKSAMEKLDVTRSEVDSIIENSSDYFWSVDNNYRIVYANKPFRKIFSEFFNEKITGGDNILEHLNMPEAKGLKKLYDRVLKGKPEVLEHSYVIGDKEYCFEVSLNPVYGRGGNISGVTCFARDVTLRKNNEKKIKHQAEDLALINKMNSAVNQGWDYKKIMGLFSRETARVFHGLGASVYLLSKDKKYLIPVKFAVPGKVVKELKRLAGSFPKEIKIYLNPAGYFDQVLSSGTVALANTPDLIRKVIVDFLPYGLPHKIAGPILKYLKFKSILTIPLQSEEGILGIIGISKPTYFSEDEIKRLSKISEQVSLILQRVKYLNTIKENEIRFRRLFEAANDAIFILEKNIFTACNTKTLDLFQCTEKDVIGRTPVDLSPIKQPDGAFSKKKALQKIRSAEQGVPVIFEWVHQRPNGSLFSCEVSLSLVTTGSSSYVQAIVRDITARKESEKQLKESEEKFRTLFMKGHFAMIHKDVKAGKNEMNESFLKLFGYSGRELKDEEILSLTHPEDRQETMETFSRLAAGKVVNITMEKRYLKKNGDIIWGYTGGTSIKNDKGEVLHVIIMIMDVTKEKETEIEARQKTDDLMIINQLNLKANQNVPLDEIMAYFSSEIQEHFFHGHFMLLSWDQVREYFVFRYISLEETTRELLFQLVGRPIKGYVVKSDKNNLFGKMFNHRRPWLVQKPGDVDRIMEAILQSDDFYRVKEQIKNILEIRSALNFPLLIGNEIIGHAVFTSSTEIKTGTLERLSFIMEQFTGILKRKLAEEEEAKLKTVIEQLTETVVITDIDGNIQYVNPAFERSSGYSTGEVIGQTPAVLKSGKHGKTFYKSLWDTILSGKTWSNKIINRNKKGSFYMENVTITPIKDENGSIVNFVAVKRDITRENQLEEQLRQSGKLETIGTLAGGIAHDFNNILGTLLGYNEMIREELPEKSKALNYSKNMNDTMLRAKSLVNQILTFSRKMEPESRSTYFPELLNDSLRMFLSAINPRIKLTSSISKKCPEIKADPSQIQQVFMNLLTNAQQAIEERGGEIKVRLELSSNSEEKKALYPNLDTPELIEFSVRDNGPGISREVKDRIFEPFFTTKPVGKGTGLGLSVVHGIVEAHGGTILVESDLGEFTCFTVYFPVH